MADELNKKKPDLNTDNSTMSSKTASEQLKPSRTQGGQFSTNVNKSPKFENNNKNTYSANSVGNKQQPKSNPKQFDATRQKIVNQGFAPKFNATQKFKWSEGLSDEDNVKINTALHNLATYAGDPDLSRVNNEWVDDLAYQLSYEGYDDDEINRLIDHFDKTAPTYEEAFPEYKSENEKDSARKIQMQAAYSGLNNDEKTNIINQAIDKMEKNGSDFNDIRNSLDDIGIELEKMGYEVPNKDIEPALNQYKSDKINKTIGGRGFELPNGDYVGVQYKDGKLYAGGVTNSGVQEDYFVEYEPNITLDQNLELLYEEIGRQNEYWPELSDEEDERDQASQLFGTDLSKNPESEEDWSNKDFLKDVKSPTFLIKNKGEYPYQQNSRRAADHLYNQIIDGEKTLKRLEQMRGDQFEPKISEARRNQYLNTLRRQLAKQKNHFAKLYGKYYK